MKDQIFVWAKSIEKYIHLLLNTGLLPVRHHLCPFFYGAPRNAARKFTEAHLPYWDMASVQELIEEEDSCEDFKDTCWSIIFVKPGEVYAIYSSRARKTGRLNLTGVKWTFTSKWYHPEQGEFEGKNGAFLSGPGGMSAKQPTGYQR